MTLVDLIVFVIGLTFGIAGAAWMTGRFDLRRANFRGERIPATAGLVFVLAAAFIYGVSWLVDGAHAGTKAAFLMCAIGYGLLGFWDDVKGDRSIGGYRGHLQALASGMFTTGAGKLIGGAVLSAVAAWMLWYPYAGQCIVAFFLIPLFANTLNLLDLRPGRSLFGFFLFAAVVVASLLFQHQGMIGYLLYIAIAVAVFLYPLDAMGQIMLGDTGSNAFGAVLGVSAALYLPLWAQIVLLALLAGFNLFCERRSWSRVVEENGVLRGIDRKIGVR